MNLPRFTLREMFLATTLIGVGIGVATFTIRYANTGKGGDWPLFILLACSAVIGAGIFTPFHQKWAGAAVGIFVAIAIGLALLVNAFFHFHG
jgi:hypothetical protein